MKNISSCKPSKILLRKLAYKNIVILPPDKGNNLLEMKKKG